MTAPNQLQLEAKLFRGLGDHSRLMILETIANGEKTVSQIVEETKLSQPNTSAHLACLLECGLIRNEKRGREVFYETSSKEVVEILKQARKIIKKHSHEIYLCTHY